MKDPVIRPEEAVALAETGDAMFLDVRWALGRTDGHEAAMAALREAMGLAHHTALMEAALDRDMERARKLMEEHIGYTMDVYAHSEANSETHFEDSRANQAAEFTPRRAAPSKRRFVSRPWPARLRR